MKKYTLNQIKELMNKDKNHNVIAIVSINNDSSDYYLIKKIKSEYTV